MAENAEREPADAETPATPGTEASGSSRFPRLRAAWRRWWAPAAPAEGPTEAPGTISAGSSLTPSPEAGPSGGTTGSVHAETSTAAPRTKPAGSSPARPARPLGPTETTHVDAATPTPPTTATGTWSFGRLRAAWGRWWTPPAHAESPTEAPATIPVGSAPTPRREAAASRGTTESLHAAGPSATPRTEPPTPSPTLRPKAPLPRGAPGPAHGQSVPAAVPRIEPSTPSSAVRPKAPLPRGAAGPVHAESASASAPRTEPAGPSPAHPARPHGPTETTHADTATTTPPTTSSGTSAFGRLRAAWHRWWTPTASPESPTAVPGTEPAASSPVPRRETAPARGATRSIHDGSPAAVPRTEPVGPAPPSRPKAPLPREATGPAHAASASAATPRTEPAAPSPALRPEAPVPRGAPVPAQAESASAATPRPEPAASSPSLRSDAPVPNGATGPAHAESRSAAAPRPEPSSFSPFLRLEAALGRGSSTPRPIRLARLGVSGQGVEGQVTPIPPIRDPNVKELEVATIRENLSYVRISYDNARNEYLYEVIEPPLSEIERELYQRLRVVLIDHFEPIIELDPQTRRQKLRKMVDDQFVEWEISPSPTTKGRIIYYLERDFIGHGLIEVPMTDSEVEDISCDGVGIPLYIYHRKYGSIRSNLKFIDAQEVDDYVVWIAQRSGKHISVASPMLDATIPDGSRLQATLGRHVTKRGSSFTIRRFRDNPFTPVDLLKFRTMSSEMMAYLWIAIETGQSMMVCGGTASGKTTTLNAVLLFIPPQMKIVSIEDTRELNLPHENWVPSLTRAGFGAKNVTSGKAPGEIDMFDLLAAALRQRPQYLMVGEVRGAEAFIVFQAMATGKTCYTTFHAESVSAMVHRMENPPISLPRSLVGALNLVLLQRQVKVGNKLTLAGPVADRGRRPRPRDQRADHERRLLLEPGRRHVPVLGALVHLRTGRHPAEPLHAGDGPGGAQPRRDARVHEVEGGAGDPRPAVHAPRRRSARRLLLQGASAGARRGAGRDAPSPGCGTARLRLGTTAPPQESARA